MILLLVVSGYFWVVLRDFANRNTIDSADSTVAWIGFSKDNVSRLAFLLTLLIPLGTAGLLAWNGIGTATSLYRRISYALAALAVALLIAIISSCHRTITGKRPNSAKDAIST